MTSSPTQEDFTRYVHRALRHLYEPVELHTSPLVGVLRLGPQADVPGSLRKILLDAIRALKPDPKAPADSNAWRIYNVLCYRFEEQFSQEEVADQMAVGPRQVRRLEFVAIRALVDSLARQYGLSFQPGSTETSGGLSVEVEKKPGAGKDSSASSDLDENGLVGAGGAEAESEEARHASEFDWLKKSYQSEVTEVQRLVDTALKTGEAMFHSAATVVEVIIPSALPPVIGQITTLRQALLNILISSVRSCPRGTIFLQAVPADGQVYLNIWAERKNGEGEPGSAIIELLEMARQLAELSGGDLKIGPASAGRPVDVRLCMPVARQYRVLLVDDNQDSLHLMERYLAGTQFVFLGIRNPERIIAQAEEAQPDIIILDIMLPEIDGWELLGRLRAHPTLGSVPVVISTILPHEHLAASLGASAFLRKPVSREKLLQILSQLVNV